MSNTTGRTGTLIAVTGIDGAGKTTLAASLHAALTGHGHDAVLVGKHTTEVPDSTDLSDYIRSLNTIIYRRKQGISTVCGDYYWLFALAAWYSLQDRLIVQPALQAGTHVILDNSHHKILARYALAPGVPADLARQVFAHLTPPDVTLFLTIPAEQALHRKREFTALETGHTGSAAKAFSTYQNRVAAELRQLAAGRAWVTIDVAGKPPSAVLEEALSALAQHPGLEPSSRLRPH